MSLTVSSSSQLNVQPPSGDDLLVVHQIATTVTTVAEGKTPFMPEQNVTAKMGAVTLGDLPSEQFGIVVEKYSNLRSDRGICKISLSGANTLSNIHQYPDLKSLTLKNCPSFADTDLDDITGLVVGKLVELELENLPMITKAGLERMCYKIKHPKTPVSLMSIRIIDPRISEWEGKLIPENTIIRDPSFDFYKSYRRLLEAVDKNVRQGSPVLNRGALASESTNELNG